MRILQLLVVAFNVAVITFLIYRMLKVLKEPMERWRKITILAGGAFLLLVPFGFFFRIYAPTPQYFLIYPVAIGFFLYLMKQF